ncbi:hypothetical protein LQ384_24980 [Rhodococcus rhodochrous]|uniref:Centromere-binding protein ParB C-terminal domain-containing protein n=1 Tax=Rhodococcus rhodochrous TaxID=1829 RepID=A0AAW4XMS2_RHORH|nr:MULTISPECIES: hypothetical protein [Rhodococcus]MCD2114367.1 hypothetical protein [Rhodococcus rhodochrous]MDV6296749.1 hypothetical protein [Rhodococcus aetherivorans]
MSGIPEPTRPTPRRARNTFAQAKESLAADDAISAMPVPVAQQAGATPAPVAQQAAPAPKKRKVATTDILLSVSEELKERMVATLEHTRPRTGITSQQQFIRIAIEQLCKRLESDFNNGEAFPPPAQGVNL